MRNFYLVLAIFAFCAGVYAACNNNWVCSVFAAIVTVSNLLEAWKIDNKGYN